MLNQDVVNLFWSLPEMHLWKQHCQNNNLNCTFNPEALTKNNVRANYNLDYREDILFLRDTSFWNSANQGLVLTDTGLKCIPDSNTPDERIEFLWEIVQSVSYSGACIYFHGYDEEVCPIHITYFTKDLPDNEIDIVGPEIAMFLNDVVNAVVHVDPFDRNVMDVDQLVQSARYDDAISFIKSIVSQDEEQYKSFWYYRMCEISRMKGNGDDQAVRYSTEGLKHCEEGSQISVWLRNMHRSSLIQQFLHEARELEQDYSSIVSIPYTRIQRWESFWVSRNAVEQTYDDGTLMKDDAASDFQYANSLYCNNFIRQPYNERKVLLVVKDYEDLRQFSLCVMKKSDIPSNMSFPAGHPQEGQIYVGHPFIPSKYVPFDEYQLDFIEDKVREFTWLMQCMGATKISISATSDNEKEGDSSNTINLSANGSYGNVSAMTFAEQISKAIKLNQEFNPTSDPYIPEGLVWYQNEPSWQRLAHQRMEGSLTHATESIESRKNSMVSGAELQTIRAEFESLVSIDGEWSRQEGTLLSQNENATLFFEIDFAPVGSSVSASAPVSESVSVPSPEIAEAIPEPVPDVSPEEEVPVITEDNPFGYTKSELEYVEEVKACLADGEIGPRERRYLDRFAVRLGITPEHAIELETPLLPAPLTEEEEEYLEEVQYALEKGAIDEWGRTFLDKTAKRLGISPERAEEIEAKAIRENDN